MGHVARAAGIVDPQKPGEQMGLRRAGLARTSLHAVPDFAGHDGLVSIGDDDHPRTLEIEPETPAFLGGSPRAADVHADVGGIGEHPPYGGLGPASALGRGRGAERPHDLHLAHARRGPLEDAADDGGLLGHDLERATQGVAGMGVAVAVGSESAVLLALQGLLALAAAHSFLDPLGLGPVHEGLDADHEAFIDAAHVADDPAHDDLDLALPQLAHEQRHLQLIAAGEPGLLVDVDGIGGLLADGRQHLLEHLTIHRGLRRRLATAELAHRRPAVLLGQIAVDALLGVEGRPVIGLLLRRDPEHRDDAHGRPSASPAPLRSLALHPRTFHPGCATTPVPVEARGYLRHRLSRARSRAESADLRNFCGGGGLVR